jgi:hypothetical protein
MMNEIENLKQRLGVQLWGRQRGFIRVLGEKVNLPKPRVREEMRELRLETYDFWENETKNWKTKDLRVYCFEIGTFSGIGVLRSNLCPVTLYTFCKEHLVLTISL